MSHNKLLQYFTEVGFREDSMTAANQFVEDIKLLHNHYIKKSLNEEDAPLLKSMNLEKASALASILSGENGRIKKALATIPEEEEDLPASSPMSCRTEQADPLEENDVLDLVEMPYKEMATQTAPQKILTTTQRAKSLTKKTTVTYSERIGY